MARIHRAARNCKSRTLEIDLSKQYGHTIELYYIKDVNATNLKYNT